MGSNNSRPNVVQCETDNDCYKEPGWPAPAKFKPDGTLEKAAEKDSVCCMVTKVKAYDTTATMYNDNLTRNQQDVNATWTYPDIGYTERRCKNDYPKWISTNVANDLTLDSIYASTGVQNSIYCNHSV